MTVVGQAGTGDIGMLAPSRREVRLHWPRFMRSSWTATLFVAVMTAALLVYYRGSISPDVAGQFWNARSMRGGARLYVDIVEVNPPLWFWMAMPIDALAQAIGCRTEPVTILAVGALVLAAIHATNRLLPPGERGPQVAFLLYVAAILLVLPARTIEQREHLALIAAVPYLVLAAARRDSGSVERWLAVTIGVGAGLCFSLKPHFLAVPLLAELWLVWGLGRSWRPWRPELLAMAATGLAYGAAILIVTPHYLSDAVPMLLVGYKGVGPTFVQTINFLVVMWACFLAGALLRWRALRNGSAPIAVAFLLGAAGFGFAWAAQHKGWLYQSIPTTGCLALAIAALLLQARDPAPTLFRLVAPALLLWPTAFAFVDAETRITPDNDIAPALADLRAGDHWALISTAGATTWPSTIGRDLHLSSRHGAYWMLKALDKRPDDLAAQALARRAVRETAIDFRCQPPKVIVIIRLDRKDPAARPSVDPLRFFLRDPAFAAVLGHYRLAQRAATYDAFRPISPLPAIDRSLCPRPR